jgi:hypothetical protein
VEGGRPRASDPKYYAVASRDELISAFGQITGQVLGCVFKLSKPPPSPNDVAVNVGGMRLKRDPGRTSGWDYTDDKGSIELHGSPCQEVKAATNVEVDIIYGCPNVVIE